LIIKHLPNGNDDKKATTTKSVVLKRAKLTQVFVDVISTAFKMKIIFIIVLVTETSLAFRTRDNPNVLVPNNDVNVHANIKRLLEDDDFDTKQVNAFMRIEKLFKPIFEKNLAVLPPPPVMQTNNLNFLDNEDDEENGIEAPMIPSPNKEKRTSTTAVPNQFEPELEFFGNETTPIGGNSTFIPETTSAYSSSSTYNFNITTSTVFGNNTTTTMFRNVTTSLPYTSSTIVFGNSTVLQSSTTVLYQNTTTTSFFTIPTQSTTSIPEQNPTAKEECLLGKVSETLQWVDEYGVLQMAYINSSREMKDLFVADYSIWNFSMYLPQLEASIFFSQVFLCFCVRN
jgi:hypothetical protein